MMQTVTDTPSSVLLAPQPPPSGPMPTMNRRPSSGLMPWMLGNTRSAWWPAIERLGIAGASALKMVSITVIGKVIHTRIGYGRSALITVPMGMITFNDRKLPSLTG
ncbi:hypothetical protein D9M68_711940 [compost metagenome]